MLIVALHLLQPLARLKGRLKHGLSPWRRKVADKGFIKHFSLGSQYFQHWSEEWRAPEAWLEDVERALIWSRARVRRSGVFDRWDLQVRNSLAAVSHCLMTLEEHGGGKQMLRFKVWSRPSNVLLFLFSSFASLCVGAFVAGAIPVALVLGMVSLVIVLEYVHDAAAISSCLQTATQMLNPQSVVHTTFVESEGQEPEAEAYPAYRRVLLNKRSEASSSEMVTTISGHLLQEETAAFGTK
jgi:hypothetical protein